MQLGLWTAPDTVRTGIALPLVSRRRPVLNLFVPNECNSGLGAVAVGSPLGEFANGRSIGVCRSALSSAGRPDTFSKKLIYAKSSNGAR